MGDVFFLQISVSTAKKFHESLLYSILRCGMHFFESTPTGRILNRLAKDIEATENKIPEQFRAFMNQLFNCLSVIVVIIIASPFLLVFLLPIMAIYFFIQVRHFIFLKWFYRILLNKQFKRESILNSQDK
jgi:ABC-type multidrug transport system fused ATPase/permease subunit